MRHDPKIYSEPRPSGSGPSWRNFPTLFVMTVSMAGAIGAERDVTIQTVAPAPLAGRLISFNLRDGATIRIGADQQTIPAADVVRIKFDPPDRTPEAETEPVATIAPDDVFLTLAWGDELHGQPASAEGDALTVKTDGLGPVTVPLDAVARLTTPRSAQSTYRASAEWFSRQPGSQDDAILLTNGDVVRGFITRIDGEGVAIDSTSGPMRAPYRLIVAASLTHPEPRPVEGLNATVSTRDGQRVCVLELEWASDGARMRLRAGDTVLASGDRLRQVSVLGGRWVWLSDLRPGSEDQVPLMALSWDHRVNRNVLGGPLVVAGESFERGLGVHSRSVLRFELDEGYHEFVTSYGLDDAAGPLADVTVAVLVDGQRRHEKTQVRRGILHGPIRLDVTHAKRLELIVDFGANGDLQDRFDWIAPALIR